ncbi:DUF4184 family protein [Flavobacterium sp. MC2016-06]|jgi:hypothetical protein|uniref:DUF4184 family protein n=1 Tax=Flavobacterium sp. MC2016-06 TaxID=2676308 RepID=UPI0012BAF061|nr:DUF4184 family protein [Flavobacterium sp. MC2016-06]MBU3862105.1 DUF4184 family protein [Flavobacterium sp. MC2016-06]
MPFTFSHPAIILPLNYLPKKWFSLTGLIIGSLTPDFEYFIRMKVQSNYSHTFAGIFWFDLPLAILIAFLYHNIVRDNLSNNLPKFLRERIQIFNEFNWNSYFKNNTVVVLISILIGISSHLFWDSFTHEHGYFINRIALLKETVTFINQKIPVFKIAQHLSTFIGGIIIVIALFKLPTNKTSNFPSNKKYWLVLTLMTFTIVSLRILCGLNYNLYGHLIVTFISAILISLILTPVLIKSTTFTSH